MNPNGWTLVSLCEAAGVSRSAGRTAIKRGLLRRNGWQDSDVVVLAAAAALMGLHCPAGVEVAAQRDRRAISDLKAALSDRTVTESTVLLASPEAVALVDGARPSLAEAIASFAPAGSVAAVGVGTIAARLGVVAG